MYTLPVGGRGSERIARVPIIAFTELWNTENGIKQGEKSYPH